MASIAGISALSVICVACTGSGEPSGQDSSRDTAVHVLATERAPVLRETPTANPAGWLLAFVDVETTGLVPGYHEMIDLGLVITDLDGVRIDSLFLRIQPEHPERLSEGAREVNAFDA